MAVGHANGLEARPLSLFALRPGFDRGSSFRGAGFELSAPASRRSLHDALHDFLHDSLGDDGRSTTFSTTRGGIVTGGAGGRLM